MLVKEKKSLDDDENGIYLKNVDEDGLQICEKGGGGEVYVYYSEIEDLIKLLKEFKEKYYKWLYIILYIK